MDHAGGLAAVFIILGRVMLAGGIDVLVTQDIRDQIDVAGLFIKMRAKGGTQLVRCDLF